MKEYVSFDMMLLDARPWIVEGYLECMKALFANIPDRAQRMREMNRIYEQAEKITQREAQEFRKLLAATS